MTTHSLDVSVPLTTIDDRRRAAVKEWALTDEIVVVYSGNPISKPGGADQCFEFHAHPHFRWLTGLDLHGSAVVYDPKEGWTEFLHETTDLEMIWEGAAPLRRGSTFGELDSWLEARNGRKISLLGSLMKMNGVDIDLTAQTDIGLLHVRRPKDPHELRIMQRAVDATQAGFDFIKTFIAPGVTERAIQIELEAVMQRNGADGMGYSTIVGTGSNSAIFHFTPSNRAVQNGDIILIDAGGEIDGYTADVTRVFSADGKFSPQQQEIYDVLLNAQIRAIARCTKGTEWRSVHTETARDIAEGLRTLGLLKCSADEALNSEAISLFLPHGVGHMVGLGVRDAGGVLRGRTPSKCCGVNLRVDLPLEMGYVMTVEPGIYFLPALLNNVKNQEKFKTQVDFDKARALIPMGGMRIEDNVLVTAGEPEVLTVGIGK